VDKLNDSAIILGLDIFCHIDYSDDLFGDNSRFWLRIYGIHQFSLIWKDETYL
jgi:hypothetical protein